MQPITAIAEALGVPDDCLEPYGRFIAKLRLELLQRVPPRRGKLVLVTAISPTTSGEGKTVTTIGLTQGLVRRGHRAVAALREPSLGPVFGQKGGATGGGRASLLPLDRINLHFTGDFHAITAAHNLLAALLDNHLHFGNTLDLDSGSLSWPRAVDMNDRALREIVVGLGGPANGPSRGTGFVITAASEVMAILALADSREDLRQRLARIVVGFTAAGKPVLAADLQAVGAMMVLLNDALMPNLVQTTEGAAAIVHAGPFANIAHGTSSVLAQRMGLALADYVVNETGFGADLGAEKFFDIVMPQSGHVPDAAVVIVTAKSVQAHGGFDNLRRHLDNLALWRVPVVVAINRFPSDEEPQLAGIAAFCAERGVAAAVAEGYARGGEGMLALADAVVSAATQAQRAAVKPLYPPELSLEEKIRCVATTVYGAEGIAVQPLAQERLQQFEAAGYGRLPVCIAKTQYSFTGDPKLTGAPTGWTLDIGNASLAAGAGFVVAQAGNMLLMPGLGRSPQAFGLDVDGDGRITGMDY